jgi:hypothetical protein
MHLERVEGALLYLCYIAVLYCYNIFIVKKFGITYCKVEHNKYLIEDNSRGNFFNNKLIS